MSSYGSVGNARAVARPQVTGIGRVVGAGADRFQLFEYAFYALIVYSLMGQAIGLSIPLFGIGGITALAGLCVLRLESTRISIRRSLISAIFCAVLFVGIQVLAHGESLSHGYVSAFIPWVMMLIVVQALLTRPGFFRRSTNVIFLMGLMVLPFLKLDYVEGRAGLDPASQIVLANPNSLGAWFGFCALVFTLRGLEARQPIRRSVLLLIALFSLFVAALTVSRSPMAAAALAMVFALRSRLKRGFLPMVVLFGIGGMALVAGVFDGVIAKFTDRGLEETGRFVLWPIILRRIADAPFVGVGVSEVGTNLRGLVITPHNGVLFIALAAGIIPMLFFLGYWFRGLRGALKGSSMNGPESAYLLPLIVYAFLVTLSLNQVFADPWVVLSVGVCLHYLGLHDRNRRHPPAFRPVPSREAKRVFLHPAS